jgi:hypothetical protein
MVKNGKRKGMAGLIAIPSNVVRTMPDYEALVSRVCSLNNGIRSSPGSARIHSTSTWAVSSTR